MSVRIETIADLVGHRTTIVTQKVYRHQLRPVMTKGATTMNTIFTKQRGAADRMTLWLPVWLPQTDKHSKNQWAVQDLNLWPLPCQGSALPLS